MKFLRYIILMATAAVIMAACDKPKVIPDSELVQILREVYITNAYYENSELVKDIPMYKRDSIDYYRPILAKYGYKFDDLSYTIDNFSKRKSARFADIVEEVITKLEHESEYYTERVAALDTIDARAARMFRKVVYTDSLIKVDNVKDTAMLRVKIPIEEGRYEIRYNYFIDSLDKNPTLRSYVYFRDTVSGRWAQRNILYMSKNRRTSQVVNIDSDPRYDTMLLNFGGLSSVKLSRPYIRIDSLEVVHFLPRDVARDSLSGERLTGIRVRTFDNMYAEWKKDRDERLDADSTVYVFLPGEGIKPADGE